MLIRPFVSGLSALLLSALVSLAFSQTRAQATCGPHTGVQYGASGSKCATVLGRIQTVDDSTAFNDRFFSSITCNAYTANRPNVEPQHQGLLAQVVITYEGQAPTTVTRGILVAGQESLTTTATLTLASGDFVTAYTVSAGQFVEGLLLKTKAGKELSCGVFLTNNVTFTAGSGMAFTALFGRTPLPTFQPDGRKECISEFWNDIGFTQSAVSCFASRAAATTSSDEGKAATEPSKSTEPAKNPAPTSSGGAVVDSAMKVPTSIPPTATNNSDGATGLSSTLGIVLVSAGTLSVVVVVIFVSTWYARRKRKSDVPLVEDVESNERISLVVEKKPTRDRFSVASSEGSASFSSLQDDEAYTHFVSLQGSDTVHTEAKRYAPTYLAKQLSYIAEEDDATSSEKIQSKDSGKNNVV